MDFNQQIYLSQEEAVQFFRFGGNARLLSLSLQEMIEEDIKAELEDISREHNSPLVEMDSLEQVVHNLDFKLEDSVDQSSLGVSQGWASNLGLDVGYEPTLSNSKVEDMTSVMVDPNELVPYNPYHNNPQQHTQKFVKPSQSTAGSYVSYPSGSGARPLPIAKRTTVSPTPLTSYPAKKKNQLSHPPGYQGEVSGFPKPAYSYSCLIGLALKNSQTGSMTVSEIYKFMCEHFPYFTTAPPGWKNSVRHNLSLNKCFMKIDKHVVTGSHHRKGCLWAMNPDKITKMEEEVTKWSKRDPMGIRKGMLMPDTLEALERGELVRDYSSNANDPLYSEY